MLYVFLLFIYSISNCLGGKCNDILEFKRGLTCKSECHFYIFIYTQIYSMNATKESSYEKGKRFEDAFCRFMENELGYSKAERKYHVHSKNDPKGIELDIVARKPTQQARHLMRLSIRSLAIGFGISVLMSAYKHELTKEFFLVTLLLIGILLSIYFLTKRYMVEYAWVECKNWEPKVSYRHVDTMLNQFKDHGKSKDSTLYFSDKYFVAANGFVPDALTHALINKIKCYICTDGNFVQVTQ